MWILPVTRRDLVDLITPRGGDVPGAVEEHRPSFDIVRPDAMAAVWPMRPAQFGRMPTVIIVPEGSHRDTLAWLITYVRDYRPFTAFCRVVERAVAEQFLRGPTVPSLLGSEGICAGLILGESLAHSRGRVSVLDLPVSAYSATLSHAISRTFALTGGVGNPEIIERLWVQARDMTGQNGLGVHPGAILSVWAVALGTTRHAIRSPTLFDSSDVLRAAWGELSTVGEIRDPVWKELVEGLPELVPMRSMVDRPREQRVEVIDLALKALLAARRDSDERRSFLAGYLASLLAPGTLDHTDILAPVAPILPTAYLWFGLCAGVNVRGDALPAGNPLARRIVRDLTIPDRLIDRPRCDVAIEEMALFGPGDNVLRPTAKTERLGIDILPGVTTAVRWPPHDAPHEEEMRRVRDEELQHLLMDMEDTAMRWRHLTARVRELMGASERNRPPATRRKRGDKT